MTPEPNIYFKKHFNKDMSKLAPYTDAYILDKENNSIKFFLPMTYDNNFCNNMANLNRLIKHEGSYFFKI